jgi:hypothetical protein
VGCRTSRILNAPDLVGFRPAEDGFGAPGAILDERILLSGLRAALGFGTGGLPAGLCPGLGEGCAMEPLLAPAEVVPAACCSVETVSSLTSLLVAACRSWSAAGSGRFAATGVPIVSPTGTGVAPIESSPPAGARPDCTPSGVAACRLVTGCGVFVGPGASCGLASGMAEDESRSTSVPT